jgi:hypothetical protein
MTLERGSRVKELHEGQPAAARNWAVGFYNDVGCYAIGRAWKDQTFPKTKNFAFTDGAYAIKLLFTTASVREGASQGSVNRHVTVELHSSERQKP